MGLGIDFYDSIIGRRAPQDCGRSLGRGLGHHNRGGRLEGGEEGRPR